MKIITSKPACVWKSKTLLGEGTLWVKSLNSIFFVDIKKKKIFILNTKNKKTADIYMHSAGKLSFWASELMITEFGNTQEEAIKSSMGTLLKMLDFYKQDAANNYAKTGEYILGSYMEQDTNSCKIIAEQTLQKIRN